MRREQAAARCSRSFPFIYFEPHHASVQATATDPRILQIPAPVIDERRALSRLGTVIHHLRTATPARAASPWKSPRKTFAGVIPAQAQSAPDFETEPADGAGI